jgi:hypothetical protein
MRTLEKRAHDAMTKLGERGRTTRIPDEVREAVVAFAGEARSAGATWKQIGDRVGLSASVVQRWWRSTSRTSAWSDVVVTDDRAVGGGCAGLVLVTPSGYRIEGLSLDAVERVIARVG